MTDKAISQSLRRWTQARARIASSLSDLTLNAAPAIGLESGIDSGRVAGLF
jgi:hypothetical protein